jgi:RNA polymerase sigma-B factor
MRFFDDLTQAEIARRLGISQMHVSRLLRKALEKAHVAIGMPSETRCI